MNSTEMNFTQLHKKSNKGFLGTSLIKPRLRELVMFLEKYIILNFIKKTCFLPPPPHFMLYFGCLIDHTGNKFKSFKFKRTFLFKIHNTLKQQPHFLT